jgi:hypothetical protein
VVLSINGVAIEGFGETDAVSVEVDEDSWVKSYGADGEAVRSRTNADGARFTVTLRQTAEANAILQAALLVDQLTGSGVFAISIFDPSVGEEVFAEEAWIVKSPTKSWAKAVGDRQWMIDCAVLREVRLTALPLPF